MGGFIWVVLSVAVAIAALVKGDVSHYTWWYTYEFCFLCALAYLGYGHLFHITFIVQGVIVLVGVFGMSIWGCKMLTDAANNMSLLYIPANFAIHYLPLLIICGATILGKFKKPANYYAQVELAVGIFIMYASTTNAPHVYGCEVPRGVACTIGLATGVIFSLFGRRYI